MNVHRTALVSLVAFVLCCGAAVARPPTVPVNPSESRPPTRQVSVQEYNKAVADFTTAFAAAEQARQRLAVVQPVGGKPDPMDCFFHPWRPGCQDIWAALEQNHGNELRAVMAQNLVPSEGSDGPAMINPWAAGAVGWVVTKALDYTWSVGVCLYKADGSDGRGLEGPDGMKKFGNCFVKPGIASGTGGGSRFDVSEASPRLTLPTNAHLALGSGNWTQWLNRDSPGGSGDYETLQDFLKAGQACPRPLGVDCQTTDGVEWQQAGQVYSCTIEEGGVCRNDAQSAGAGCRDYRVRFLCP